MTSEAIAQQPHQEFMHRESDGCSCAICGTTARPLAFHVLQQSYSRDDAEPKGFMVLSMSVDAVHGIFPVCDRCAPACSTCGRPVASERVLEFARVQGANLGDGACQQHAQLGERLKAAFKRTFKLGRFKNA
ncbi:MAG TPA: hypothetical protein VIO83_03870 [Pseudomonas sp.]